MLDETLEEPDETSATGTEGKDPGKDPDIENDCSTVEDKEREVEFLCFVKSSAEGASATAAPGCAFAAARFFGSAFEGAFTPEDEETAAGDDWAAVGAVEETGGTTAGDAWAAGGAPFTPEGTTAADAWAAGGVAEETG